MNRILILRTSLSLFLKQSTILSLLSFWYSSKDFFGCFLNCIRMCYSFYDRMDNRINKILSVTQQSYQIYAATYWRVGNEFCSFSINTKKVARTMLFWLFLIWHLFPYLFMIFVTIIMHMHYSKTRFELLPQLIRLPLSLYHQTFLQPLCDKSDSIDIFSSSWS